MNEADARRVLALREIEAAPAGTLWSAADRDWATRAAVQSVGRQAAAEPFLAERARLALQRVTPRLPALAAALEPSQRRAHVVAGWAVALAVLAGIAIDSLSGTHHINLLAPPLWGVLAWNLVVYALLLLRLARPSTTGALVRWVQALEARAGALLSRGPDSGGARSGHAAETAPAGADRIAVDTPAARGQAPLLRAVGVAWSHASAAASLARTLALLHALAAALALGLVGGLYLRGLVFDIRAGWQSTFLDADAVHALLSFVLAPAALLSGIELPDLDALGALRTTGAGEAAAQASAAPWIHLLALSVALVVVLPRALLAAWTHARARRLAADVPLALHEPYFQRLLREQRGSVAHVHLVAHAHAPDAAALATLAALLGRVLGPHVELSRAAVVDFGAEDDAAPDQLVPPGTTHALLLVDLTATPEPEHQGRLAQRLAATAATQGATALICIDEAAFLRRFAAWPQRATERRQAWHALAEACGVALVVLNLGPAGTPGAAATGAGALERGLETAARSREAHAERVEAP